MCDDDWLEHATVWSEKIDTNPKHVLYSPFGYLIIWEPHSCSIRRGSSHLCIPVTIFPSISTFSSKKNSNQTHTMISLSRLLYMVYNNRKYRTTPSPPHTKTIYLCCAIFCKSDHSVNHLLSVVKIAWSLMFPNRWSDATLQIVWHSLRHSWVPWTTNYPRLWAVGAKNETKLCFLCDW